MARTTRAVTQAQRVQPGDSCEVGPQATPRRDGNKRTAIKDLPTGPTDVHSTVLSIEDVAIIVAFRRRTLLPLDDCLYGLQVRSGVKSVSLHALPHRLW